MGDKTLGKAGHCLIHHVASAHSEMCFSHSEGKDSKPEGVSPSPVSLVPEEKVSFGLYALSVSSLTVARIRKVYNKLDSKAIAKQVSWNTQVEEDFTIWLVL